MAVKVMMLLGLSLLLILAGMGQPANACSLPPSTPTPTPDANGYIPPPPTHVPTATPEPIGTQVARAASHAPVIVEGELIPQRDLFRSSAQYYPYDSLLAVERHYKGSADGTVIRFVYYPPPCSGLHPAFLNRPAGVYFLTVDGEGRNVFDTQFPADDSVRNSLSLVIGPGHAPRDAATPRIPMVIGLFGLSLAVCTAMLRFAWLRR
jgi:hypothetical protein